MPADGRCDLTLILLMWRMWWASNNASRWQIGFSSAFKELITRENTNTLSTFALCYSDTFCALPDGSDKCRSKRWVVEKLQIKFLKKFDVHFIWKFSCFTKEEMFEIFWMECREVKIILWVIRNMQAICEVKLSTSIFKPFRYVHKPLDFKRLKIIHIISSLVLTNNFHRWWYRLD